MKLCTTINTAAYLFYYIFSKVLTKNTCIQNYLFVRKIGQFYFISNINSKKKYRFRDFQVAVSLEVIKNRFTKCSSKNNQSKSRQKCRPTDPKS